MEHDIAKIHKLFKKGEYNKAISVCDKMLADNENNVDALILKTTILSIPDPVVSDPGTAIRLLKKALERNPDSAVLHSALAEAYDNGSGEDDLALEEYKKAIELSPDTASAYFLAGTLYQHPCVKMTLEESISYLKKAAQLDPNVSQHHSWLGSRLWENGQLEEATAALKSAMKLLSWKDRKYRKQIAEEIDKIAKGYSYQERFGR